MVLPPAYEDDLVHKFIGPTRLLNYVTAFLNGLD